MNKKTLLIKIVEFIHRANLAYKGSNTGDIWLLIFITFMSMFGMIATILTIFIVLALRAVYEFDILKRLGVINEEENKKDDDQTFKNIR